MRVEDTLTRESAKSGAGDDPDADLTVRAPDPTASSRHSPEDTRDLTYDASTAGTFVLYKTLWRIWAASRPAAGEHWTTLFSRLETIQATLGFGDDFPRCANCELGAGHDGPCPRSALE